MTCHLCGTPLADAPVVGTMSRGGKPSRRVACVRCGLVQVSPQPSVEELDEYYRTKYHEEHGPVRLTVTYPDRTTREFAPDDPDYSEAVDTMHRSRAKMVIADLCLPRGASVLEIGCSDGRTLAELQRNEMVVAGIEPDAVKAETACTDLQIQFGTLSGVWIPDWEGSFDAVIAFHVLEHLPDPLASLAIMRKLLKPGGKVWFEVPNVLAPSGQLATWHWQWVHMFDFCPHTMMALLSQAGFRDLEYRDADGPVRAWAVDCGDMPRAFDDHGGPNGAAVAKFLAHAEGEMAKQDAPLPEKTPLERWLEGASAAELDERAMRQEFLAYRESVRRLAKTYDEAAEMIGHASSVILEEAQTRLEAWHEDSWQHGFVIGEGYALSRAGGHVASLANAMRLREIGDENVGS